MNKEKFLKWVEMRLDYHKEKKAEIHAREFSKPFDHREYDYHIGARSELVFVRQCVAEYKAFDLPYGPQPNESAKDES